MMKNFVNSLFKQAGFEQMSEGSEQLFGRKGDNEQSSYWILTESNDLNIIDYQTEIYKKQQDIAYAADFDKNCSLVVLHQRDQIDTVSFKKQILAIEENPYYFKKYVLYYSFSALEELKIEQNDKTSLSFLQSKMTNRECFNIYKSNPNAMNWQSLIYRLAHKLPFIKVNTTAKNGIRQLVNDNRIELFKKNNGTLDQAFTDYFENMTTQDINELSPADILKSLNLDIIFYGNKD
jgi:hypothetical protein